MYKCQDDTGATPGGTSTTLDPMGRTLSVIDALSHQSSASYGLGSANGDSGTYATATSVDANSHVQVGYLDGLSRTRYVQVYSGLNGGTLTVNTQTATQYNAIDKVTSVVVTDLAPQSGQTITAVTTTAQYDDMGGMTSLSDPDRGTHSYTYDPNGRLLTDVSGTRTIGASYDLLGRAGCIQDAAPTTDGSGSCSSGSHPLVQNTYDTSVLGTAGSTDFPVQQITQSVATTYYDPTDYTNKTTVTQQFQHDQHGQLVTRTLQLGVPGGWGVTTALPTYQQTQAYNAIGQPTTTQTTMGGAAGSTSSQVYESTTGQLTGLSNNSTTVANLATLGYNAQGLVSDVNFQTTTGTPLATDHFSFDSVLRPLSASATWQSGSGSTGAIFSTSRTYDAVGNVTSVNTTQGAVSGQSGSGGSEAQNFCYDEQNRLLWGGNGGTQPGAGNGTCGAATLANTLTGAGYTNGFTYTHLGQLWQGPLNGAGSSQQYLYCNSAHPHQLTGLYPTGTTCSGLTGATYSVTYDAWGNLVSRSYGGATATLSYDALDHLTQWNAGSSSQEWYAYDSSGNRVLRRSMTGSGTSITVYAFGSEEHVYDAMGNPTGNTYYYTLGGLLIGALSGTSTLTTQFFLTDTLGSVLATFNAVAGSAVVLGNQVYGPYGTQRSMQGVMNTAKGFTGQYADATGLDYYNARYYDPVVGVFVSADTMQDNLHGFNPYAYVEGNPETKTDPTGHAPPNDNEESKWWAWFWATQRLGLPSAVQGLLALNPSNPDLQIAGALARETELFRNIGVLNKNGNMYRNTGSNLADALIYVTLDGQPVASYMPVFATKNPEYGGGFRALHSEMYLLAGAATKVPLINVGLFAITSAIRRFDPGFNPNWGIHMVLFTQRRLCGLCAGIAVPGWVTGINASLQFMNRNQPFYDSFDLSVFTYADQNNWNSHQPYEMADVVPDPLGPHYP